MALLALLGGEFGGCADIRRATTLPPVNPESPVAGVVGAAAMQSFKHPTFAAVPPKPLNIPPPDAVKTAVIGMVRCRRGYESWAAAHPAEVSGTGAFAETLQAQLDNTPDDRPTPAETAAAEAEAAKLRAYAAPPPPMSPGPPLTASQAAAPVATAAAPPPHPPHAAARAKIATAAPPPAAGVSATPAPETVAPQTDAPQTDAVQPSMSPLYDDPLLARCQ